MLFAGCSFCRGTGEEQPELFRDKDRNNIVKQNEKYVQESAMQRTKQLDRVLEAMKDRGFIIGKNGVARNVMAFQPPLVITEEDINNVLNTLDDVMGEVL